MEVFHRGQMFLSTRLPWHRTARGTRDEGQMEDGQYPGGHGARAEARDLEDEDENQEVAAWSRPESAMGTLPTATLTGCLLCRVWLTSVGSRLVLTTTLGSVHHPRPPLPLQLLGTMVTDPGQFSWKTSSGSPARCPLVVVQCDPRAWPDTDVYLPPHNSTERRVSWNSTAPDETEQQNPTPSGTLGTTPMVMKLTMPNFCHFPQKAWF